MVGSVRGIAAGLVLVAAVSSPGPAYGLALNLARLEVAVAPFFEQSVVAPALGIRANRPPDHSVDETARADPPCYNLSGGRGQAPSLLQTASVRP